MGDRHNVDSLNESGQTRRLLEVRFGSQAVVHEFSRRGAGFGQQKKGKTYRSRPFRPQLARSVRLARNDCIAGRIALIKPIRCSLPGDLFDPE